MKSLNIRHSEERTPPDNRWKIGDQKKLAQIPSEKITSH